MSELPPRIELYLRSLAPSVGRGEQERLVGRVQSLAEAGRIRGFEVVLSGECVCPQSVTADTATGRRLVDSYDRFVEWARGE